MVSKTLNPVLVRTGAGRFAAALALVLLAAAAPAANADAVRKNAGADKALWQAFERATYALQDSGHGVWRGANAAQRLTLEFNDREARLSHPDGSVNFHLTGYGYGDRLRKPALAKLTGTSNRVEYQRGDLTEWYLNGSQGLEQGFTLAQRPGEGREGEPLVIALGVSGGLLPAQETAKNSVLFESGKVVVLRYAGLKALDARGSIVPSRLEVRGREIRLIVEDRGAQYPLVVDPAWTQQPELTASDGAPDDNFGGSVSVSGDTAVIGAPQHYVNSQVWQGAAYVFAQSGGVWTLQQELTASDGGISDEFGTSVSVSLGTVVIGAPGHTINSQASPPPGMRAQGAAYVFTQSGGVWKQQQELTASDGVQGDGFGTSVSVSFGALAIGAPGKTFNSQFEQGAAYVFAQSGGTWSQQQELTASDGAASDQFGSSVSASSDMLAIGAPYKTIGSQAYQGAAYVFAQSGGAWRQQQELTGSDGAVGDFFGASVSVNGTTAVIGANGKTVNAQFEQGAAYVFVQSGAVWTLQQELTASDSERFGISVSMGGGTVMVGALDRIVNSEAAPGAAYVFVQSGAVWTMQQELTASDGVVRDQFGGSVSASGGTALIGAYGRNSLRGAAYIFNMAQPSISGAISAGAFGGFSAVAPGTWVEIYGSNLASTTLAWTAADFTGNSAPTSLGGAQVTIGGHPAFVDYISPGQVNAQLPSGIGPGPLQLTVTSENVTSTPVNVTVNATQPGLLAPQTFNIGAKQYVVAQLPDGTFVLPAGAIAGVDSRPAKPGETIVIYGIGFGSVVPGTPAGQIVAGENQISASLQFLFGQTQGHVSYAGLEPDAVGLYQFNVVVPQVASGNLVPFTFNLGGAAGTQTLYTAVQQ
jgi:uncharacterized protein (TIGR03437 family)